MPLPAIVENVGRALMRPFRASVPAEAKQAGSAYALPVTGGFIPTDWPQNWWQLGYDPLPAGGSAVVYACIGAYSQTIAMCPGSHWRSTGNGGRERVTNSALSRILHRPNSYQSPSDFFLYLTDCLYRQGEAFGLALRNARFEISEIHLMDPRYCRARVVPSTGDLFYSLGGNPIVDGLFAGNTRALEFVPARDVLHVRLPDPTNPLKGMAPLEAAMIEQTANAAILSQEAAFAANQARPSGVLETELELTKEQIAELRASWDLQTKGINQGGTPILGFGLKWKPSVMTSRDAQIAEKLQINDMKIATAYRVPLPLLSLFGSQGPQGSTESLMQFWVATGLGFAANHIEEAFGLLFDLGGVPDDYMEMDFATLLRANFRDRIEGLARGVQGGIYAPNEARALEELPAKRYGDEPRVQQQVVPLSAWASAPPATPRPDPPPPSPPAGDQPNADGSQRDWARAIFDAADRYDRVA